MSTRSRHKRPSRAHQRGMILVMAALMLSGLLAVGLTMTTRTGGTMEVTTRDYQQERVFNAAEGGLDYANAWLLSTLATNPNPTQEQLNGLIAPSLDGFTFEELQIVKQPFRNDVMLASGPYRGMTADIQPYQIASHASNSSATVDQVVHVTVNQEAIGLYQYGIFYDDDLEVLPDFPLDYVGRVHTNGDLHLCSHNTLDLESQVTAAGHIYNTPKDPTMIMHGKARAKDDAGQWHDLSYDSRDPNWVTKSLDDWDGNVQDSAHGVTELPFPIPVTSDPHDIIERPVFGESQAIKDKKYYYKAGLRIIDGVATDSLGNSVTLPLSVLTSSSVYDYREERTMAMRNLDMAALISNNKVPANRIIYISYSDANAAVRIKNAGTLPSGGIVIATDNPCYVQGHYNNVNKQPSSILCDAFNLYSTNWSDANASKPLNKRIAFATTVNTCIVAGNQSTTDGHYGGGAENLIRLHEKWVGHQITFRGSIVCLWESEQAVGDFEDASYVEAQRDWGFDPTLLDPALWPRDQLAATHIVRGEWRGN